MSAIDLEPVLIIIDRLDLALRHTEAALDVLLDTRRVKKCGLGNAIEATILLVGRAKSAVADRDAWRASQHRLAEQRTDAAAQFVAGLAINPPLDDAVDGLRLLERARGAVATILNGRDHVSGQLGGARLLVENLMAECWTYGFFDGVRDSQHELNLLEKRVTAELLNVNAELDANAE